MQEYSLNSYFQSINEIIIDYLHLKAVLKAAMTVGKFRQKINQCIHVQQVERSITEYQVYVYLRK